MDTAAVALIAAGIPALGAAVTYAAAEFVKSAHARRERVAQAVSRVQDALERVPVVEARPVIVRMYSRPDIEIASSAMRLFAVLPRKDKPMVFWLALQSDALARADRTERVRVAAATNSRLLFWHSDRRRARRWFKDNIEFDQDGNLQLVSSK
ncbi:hypothetical protein E3T61_13855 [Cryobacterium lactosi]|uniref:Uncharacterized protein n=1 Tax=Cryobacterium lactosi TaxID=1259202 RepID=A0A4R9BMF3_9MICO|nr:hypothetical protein [Cryobacterium lactosi]TFD86954.1 hypothetical protein E3T61_13855 [Cryobacterium lactosi]